MKGQNRVLAIVTVLTLILSQIGGVFPVFAAEGDPVLAMSIANRIDVALAVGPTSVNYSTFEADLRKALKYEIDGTTLRAHPVPDQDISIMASRAVSANTTSEFSWWTYDHTRPVPTYGGVSSYNDATHTYIEAPAAAASTTATATYLQNGSGVNYAPGVWGPGNPTTATTIVNTVGAANYAPGIGYQYADVNTPPAYYPILKFELNPDPANPDLDFYNTTNTRRLYHPYQGNNTHMVSSNSGATMDFYGYPQDSYRDWQFLPNNQKTLKTFEFSIAEDRAFDALDGIGFFFNTEVNGSYAAGVQTMSGYILFLQYSNSGVGANMTIYKFKDINTRNFHHAMNAGTSDSAKNTFAGYNGTTNATNSTTYKPLFIPVASSTIYNASDFSRRLRIEASPTQVKVYYKGSTTKDDATVLDPEDGGYTELSDLNLVNFNTLSLTPVSGYSVSLQQGTVINMDPDYIGPSMIDDFNYGFGPMAAYRAHGCARPTHIALQNLSMTVEKVKTLTEVVREPEWNENTLKYLVNLNEHTIQDFEENAVIAELLARLTNDDIYYIGWGATENAIASAAFLRKHSLKGTIVDIDPLATLTTSAEWLLLDQASKDSYLAAIQEALTYQEQIQSIADEIYKRYWNQADEGYALTTDTIHMFVSGADMQNTEDVQWPNGKWMIEHFLDEESIEVETGIYMTNFEGQYPFSGQYMPDLEPSYRFSQPGLYKIYYRNTQIGDLIIHRRPVADFMVTCDPAGYTNVINMSYDPDVYSPLGINGAARGIKSFGYTWIDYDPILDMAEPLPGVPVQLIEDHDYQITLTVEDDWGATNSISKLVTYSTSSAVTSPPFADFTLSPALFIKTSDPEAQEAQKINLNNRSYDPTGLPIASTWEIYKDEVLYPGLVITDSDFEAGWAAISVGALPAGNYKVTLTVNNGALDSAPVAKFFSIVEDLYPPTAAISLAAPQVFTGNTILALTFSDSGGSGFKEGSFAVSESMAPPPPGDPAWRTSLPTITRSVLINAVGLNYVHWEAWDNAGNYAFGYFGPYAMNKKDLDLTLDAAPEDEFGHVVYNVEEKGIVLTAALTVEEEDEEPTGIVYFYQGATFLGAATVNTSTGIATWTGNPATWGDEEEFRALYGGDSNYNSEEAQTTYPVYAEYVTIKIVAKLDDSDGAVLYSYDKRVQKSSELYSYQVIGDSDIFNLSPMWILIPGQEDSQFFAPLVDATVEFYYYESIKAVVIFNYAGGSDGSDTTKAVSGSPNGSYSTPIVGRAGYTFAGWKNLDSGLVEVPSGLFGTAGSVKIYEAQWAAEAYDVVFMDSDPATGDETAELGRIRIDFGAMIGLGNVPPASNPTGYVFLGWTDGSWLYSSAELEAQILSTVDGLTFTAVYGDATNAVAFFDYNGGLLEGASVSFIQGKPGTAYGTGNIPAPLRDGYTLSGWSPSTPTDTTLYSATAGDVMIYTALWTPEAYDVIFMDSDPVTGEATAELGTVIVDFDTVIGVGNVPPLSTPIGYVFLGWTDGSWLYSSAELEARIMNSVGGLTFTAVYGDVTNAVAFFDYNGGLLEGASTSYIQGKPGTAYGVGNVPTPARDGYVLAGWSPLTPTAATLYNAAAGDVTIYTAIWLPEAYSVRFMDSDPATGDETEELSSVVVDFDTMIGLGNVPPLSAPIGYIFLGWTDGSWLYSSAELEVKIMNTVGGLTFMAVYGDATNALAFFDYNGGLLEGASSSYIQGRPGTSYGAGNIPAPTRAGYVLSGWSPLTPTAATLYSATAGDVITYTALWTAESYDVIFMDSDPLTDTATEELGTVSVDFDTVIGIGNVPSVSTPIGYIFLGWTDGSWLYSSGELEAHLMNTVGGLTFTALYGDAANAVAFFDYNGGLLEGTVVSYIQGRPGTAYGAGNIPEPLRAGYLLEGWSPSTPTAATLFSATAGDVTIYTALWTAKTYDVIFLDSDPATGDETSELGAIRVDFDTVIGIGNIPLVTAPVGYVFLGWTEGSWLYSSAELEAHLMNTVGGLRFSAVYGDATNAVAFFDYNGGLLEGATASYLQGKPGTEYGADNIPAPLRDGYSLAGWSPLTSTDTTLFSAAAGDVMIYTALWAPEAYDVIFRDSDPLTGETTEELGTVSVDFDTVIGIGNVPSVSTPIGYIFLGWTDGSWLYSSAELEAHLMNTVGGLTFTALYGDAANAVAFFDYNGGLLEGTVVSYIQGRPGTAYGAGNIPEPLREGYLLEGWSPSTPTAATLFSATAGDVTIYTALWAAKTYDVIFLDSDPATGDETSELGAIRVDFDTVIGIGNIPIVTAPVGYVFLGWTEGSWLYSSAELEAHLMNTVGGLRFSAVYGDATNAVAFFDYNGGLLEGTTASYLQGKPGTEYGADNIPAPLRDGYSLAGWSPLTPTETTLFSAAAGDVMIYTALWAPEAYAVIFRDSDPLTGETTEELGTVSVDFDTVIGIGNVPTLSTPIGYIFLGWTDGSWLYSSGELEAHLMNTVGGLTFTALYGDAANAVAFFDYNGGLLEETVVSYIQGRPGTAYGAGNIPEPLRAGYLLEGWSPSTPTAATLFSATAGDVTIYTALWTAETYDVIFMDSDPVTDDATEEVGRIRVDFDTVIGIGNIPIVTAPVGYVFLGWTEGNWLYSSAELEAQIMNTVGGLRFSAVYGDVGNAVAFFDYNGGLLEGTTASYIQGKPGTGYGAGNIPAPLRDGYSLAGWTPLTPTEATLFSAAAGDVMIYTALWAPEAYDVIFRDSDPLTGETTEELGTVSVDFDTVIGLGNVPSVSTPIGYIFLGWTDGSWLYSSGELEAHLMNTVGGLTFTALYGDAANAVAFFDYNGGLLEGTVVSYIQGRPGTAYGAGNIPEPLREGYLLEGWSPSTPTAATLFSATAGDVTIYTALWTAKTYDVIFLDSDPVTDDATEEVGRIRVDFDTVIGIGNIPIVTAPIGYVFLGWTEGSWLYSSAELEAHLMNTVGGLRFSAVYGDATNAVAFFDFNGGLLEGATASYIQGKPGTGYGAGNIPAPLKDGYILAGWSPLTPTDTTLYSAAAGDVMIYTALWAPEAYAVIFRDSDPLTGEATEELSTINVDFGAMIGIGNVPALSTPIGYVFLGWTDGSWLYSSAEVEAHIMNTVGGLRFSAVYGDAANAVAFFDYNGGLLEGASASFIQGRPGTAYGAGNIPSPLRAGYTLDGFSPLTPTAATLFSATAGDVMKYTAIWLANEHTVTYTAFSAILSLDTEIVLTDNSPNKLPTVTPDEGYSFTGSWVNSLGGSYTSAELLSYLVTADVTFTAVVVPEHMQMTDRMLTFNANGGTAAPAPLIVLSGTTVNLTAMSATAPGGKVFIGWADKATGGTMITNVLLDINKTVYAQYDDITARTISFQAGMNGEFALAADPLANQTILAGEMITATPAVIPYPGYEFVGWQIDGAGDIIANAIIPLIPVLANLNYIAAYAEEGAVFYNLGFQVGAGSGAPDAVILPEGTTIDLSFFVATPPDGYLFIGWEDDNEPGVIITMVTLNEDKTLMAQYAAISLVGPFVVEFAAGANGTMTPMTYSESVMGGESITGVPSIRTDYLYTFLGWSMNGGDSYYSSADILRMPIWGNTVFVAQYHRVIAPPPDITFPTLGTLTYGQSLSQAVFSGGSASVPGKFIYANSSFEPVVADSGTSFLVIFIPDETAEYSAALANTVTEDVPIAVNKAPAPPITFPTAASIVEGQALSSSVFSGGSTAWGTFAWNDPSLKPPRGANSYQVTFTPYAETLANYDIDLQTAAVSITVTGSGGGDGGAAATLIIRAKDIETAELLKEQTLNVRTGESHTVYAPQIEKYSLDPGSEPSQTVLISEKEQIIIFNYNYTGNQPLVSEKIKEALETGDHISYISGYPDKTVRPNEAISRAEVAMILWRLVKNPEKNQPTNSHFTDTKNNQWYSQAIGYLAAIDILLGYPDGSFKPQQNITRAEFAATVIRFDVVTNNAKIPFADVDSEHWAYNYIASAYINEWISGYPDGSYKPNNNISRAEVAMVINRVLGRRIEKEDIPGELSTRYPDLPSSHWAFSAMLEASVEHEYVWKRNGYERWTKY